MNRETSSPALPAQAVAGQCPVCRQAIGLGGLKDKAHHSVQGRAKVQRQCPHCAATLKLHSRSRRGLQFALGAVGWICLITAGVQGLPATGALAWLGYLCVAAALALQVFAPRWYVRDV